MPVILPQDAWPAWLDSTERDIGLLRTLLLPAGEGMLEVIPVGRDVNNVRNDGPWLTERASQPTQAELPF